MSVPDFAELLRKWEVEGRFFDNAAHTLAIAVRRFVKEVPGAYPPDLVWAIGNYELRELELEKAHNALKVLGGGSR